MASCGVAASVHRLQAQMPAFGSMPGTHSSAARTRAALFGIILPAVAYNGVFVLSICGHLRLRRHLQHVPPWRWGALVAITELAAVTHTAMMALRVAAPPIMSLSHYMQVCRSLPAFPQNSAPSSHFAFSASIRWQYRHSHWLGCCSVPGWTLSALEFLTWSVHYCLPMAVSRSRSELHAAPPCGTSAQIVYH